MLFLQKELDNLQQDAFELGKVLLINKPLQWTSFDVVRKIRFTIKIKKVGHAGTLDPLATGLLIVCTGKYTKKIDHFQLNKVLKLYDQTKEIKKKYADADFVGLFSHFEGFPNTICEATNRGCRKGGQRKWYSGQLHDWSGGPRNGMGTVSNQDEGRRLFAQFVWHQSRQLLEGQGG